MLNQIKTTILLTVLTVILLIIGQLLGGISGLTIAFVIALFINFISYWFSDKIVLFMYRAKPASEEEYPKLHSMVKDLANRSNLPKPRLYIIKVNHANAFATGRNPKHSAVAVTQGILDLLSEDELKGVLAHELSHIKNRDILISTIAAVIAGAIAYLTYFARFGAMFGGRDRQGSANLFQILLLAILAPIIATLIRLSISRSRELMADESGAKLIKNSKPLADALVKLHSSASRNPIRMGNEATAHMFIVNPFSASALTALFSTHPPVNQRVGKLRAMRF